MLSKRYILFAIVIGVSLIANAANYRSAVTKPQHYMGFALSGGEGNTFSFSSESAGLSSTVKDLAGANAQFSFLYEMQYNHFLFNVGIGANYYYTRQMIAATSYDRFSGSYNGDKYQYSYAYSAMSDKQQTLSIGVPIRFGVIASAFYAMAGVKVNYNLFNNYDLAAKMYTMMDMTESGVEQIFDGSKAAEIGEEGKFGVCPPREYRSKGSYHMPTLTVYFTAEGGYVYVLPLPRNMGGTQIRIGAYFEYGLPMPYSKLDASKPMGNYDKVGKNHAENTTSYIVQNLQLPSMLDMGFLAEIHHNMSVGLKLTFMFDVTNYSYPCHCSL